MKSQFKKSQKGASVVEYAALLSLIGGLTVGAVFNFGDDVKGNTETINTALNDRLPINGPSGPGTGAGGGSAETPTPPTPPVPATEPETPEPPAPEPSIPPAPPPQLPAFEPLTGEFQVHLTILFYTIVDWDEETETPVWEYIGGEYLGTGAVWFGTNPPLEVIENQSLYTVIVDSNNNGLIDLQEWAGPQISTSHNYLARANAISVGRKEQGISILSAQLIDFTTDPMENFGDWESIHPRQIAIQ